MRQIDLPAGARASDEDGGPTQESTADRSGECGLPHTAGVASVGTQSESHEQLRGRLKALRLTLVRLIPELETIRMLIADAGLPLHRVNISGPPEAVWFGVLDEALREGVDALRSLLVEVAVRYPRNPELNALLISLGFETVGYTRERAGSRRMDPPGTARSRLSGCLREAPTRSLEGLTRPPEASVRPSEASEGQPDALATTSVDPSDQSGPHRDAGHAPDVPPTPVIRPAECRSKPASLTPGPESFEVRAQPSKGADAWRIDRSPVTHGEYRRFVELTGAAPPTAWPRGQFPYPLATCPVTGISWAAAMDYARWLEARLPTGDEWESAERLGLIEVIADVWEWTMDEVKPRGLGHQQTKRALRGRTAAVSRGASFSRERSAWPHERLNDVGFRCVRPS